MQIPASSADLADARFAPRWIIDIAGLSRSFGGAVPVLNDLSLRIAPGSYTVIRGPSGAGKTTLLRILGLLDQGYAGRFAYDGQDVAQAGPAGLDRLRTGSIGFVFQEGRFLDHLSIAENIALPLRLRGVDPAAIREPLADVAGFVFRQAERDGGLLDIRPTQASGGQRQRAALARALITRPRLILGDEPTASLDPVSRAQVVDRLRALHETGATIVVVSHDPVFFDYGTQLELSDGRLVAVDAPVQIASDADAEPPAMAPPARLSLVQSWRLQMGPGQILAAAMTGILRRPLLSLLTLVSLVAGICQVAILASLLGGVERVVEQAVTDGSRLTRVAVRPRTADMSAEDRFPLRADIAALPAVVETIPRRTASFAVVMPEGTETPYPSMGLHPDDPELRYFQFLAGSPDALAQDDFGVIATPAFLTEVLQLGQSPEAGQIDWASLLGRPIGVTVPRFDRAGQRIGAEPIVLNVAGVILAGEGSRQFYVSNRLLLATDAIRRDRSGTLALPLLDTRAGWAPGADLLPLLAWPWEDMLHIYLRDMDSVLPGLTDLVGLGFRPEAEIWDYLWILDLKEAALRIFVPMLGLLVVVISLVLISNVYVSARLRRGELALCRVLGLGRGDLLATEILSVVLLAVVAIGVGLFAAQGLIDVLTAQFRARAELLAGLPDASADGVTEALFTPIVGFAPHLALSTVALVVAAVLWPSVKVARTDPALVFSRG
jgi:putative ABC transport system ATP-binding protein